eukprot:GFUD01040911.1.p1 GENE.GFUD01040911.1~~GFUD01040911.1.p1  ORF type:complete len:2557 (+),score=666.17 GFUD01040911.1:40-7710(+)
MGKDKSRSKMKKGKKKKSFLDIQKKHKREIKRTNKDPNAKVDETRFKFQNFSDQVASVEASIVYQLAGVGTIQVDPDSNACVFSETLTYWRDMNLTTQFQECDKKLSKFTSLTQVIFSQTDIVSILCDYLSRGSLLNIQPVLELTAALATDLQQEYYPHLEKVLDILIGGPLTIRDATVIKWSLRCLGHLLKILWKPISLNLSAVYNQCSKLFSYSKPDFIRYLGAETLSFLVRKCGEKEKFLIEILNFDKTTTDSKAISKLLFESIRTVNDQFNTHCQKLWPLYIEHLTEEKGDILEDITEFCAEHSSREFISPILGTLFDKIDLLKTDKVASTNQLIKCLTLLVKLKAGKLIKDTERFCTFFEDSRILEIASSELLELVGRFLMADKLHLSKDKVDSIVSKVLSGEHFSLEMKLDLVSDFSDHPVFESSILRPYLVLVQSQIKTFQSQIITHLAQTIQSQVPSPTLGSELQDWEPFLLDLQMVRELRSVPEEERFTRVIVDQLSVENPLDDVKNALVCVGSLKPIKKPAVLAKLSSLADEIISLQEKSSEKVALLPLIISTIVHIADYEAIPNLMKVEDVIELFLKNINDKPRIRALNFLISSLSVSGSIPNLGEEKLKTILVSLQSSLSSPDGDVRQLCLHTILTLLPLLGKQVKKVYEENQISLLGVFETLLSAEQCAESLTSYKDKLNQLEKVDYARIARVLAENDFLSLAPVHHLFGLLYTNFTLMWSPLMDLLANYGNGMKRDVFWEVMGDKLRAAEKDVLDMINKIKEGKAVMDEKRIDYINYRNHLLDIVSRFPRVAEAKNRELVPLFLDTFMTEEYVEIRKLSEDKSVEFSHKSVIQSTIKSLLSHLNIFVKFQDLKSLHRSSELRELVLNLLCHKLAPVQKLALEILIAYKLKFLVPYKENLLKLLDEKDFKAELIAFPLAGEDTPIKEEHRADFIPIILRILYGRLRAKKAGGKKQGGKGTVNARRGLILHHMMELSEDEMTVFFDLVFKDLFTGSNLGIGENVNEYILNGGDAVDKSSKQMQACIEMVQVIISKLGKLLNTSLTYILSVINWLGFTVQKMIDVENHSNLKSLRNTIYSVLANFYNKYTNYQFTETENQAVFQVFVWKMLENFESDFIHSSSGVLQLLMSWSKTQAYRPLFLLLHPTNNSRVLENVCKVLVKPSTNAKVIDTVLDIIHNLITEDDVMEVDDEDCQKEGALIVLKEMDNILAHFQAWLKATNENIRNLKKVGIKLDILATIAPHVTNPEDALIFFKQLITLSNSLKKPETVLKVLTITKLLMIHIPNDKVTDVVTELIPLFGKLATRDERLELSLVIQNSSKNEPALSFVTELCVELNSYDKRRVEEPDFERRMNIFKKIRDVAKEGTEMTHLELKSVIYNCCFFLKNETDSSLKANALEAINTITKVFKIMAEKDSDISKTLIDKICFGQIKTGIKNKDDSVRCDFISFLQSLITNCADFNPRLKDLSKLTDEDMDSNFLENMRHVQLHRRGRVMTKLASQLDLDSNFIKFKNLTQLVLPLAGTYLLTDSYAKNSDLVDQSIMLVGSIARCLPWPQYENSVKYYIELFTKDTQHQKQLVKITTAVLDAFHFEVGAEFEKSLNLDASKAEGDSTNKTKDEILKSKIFFTVNNVLLPKLHATLSGKTKGPTAVSDEDKLILRVPLAIPIIKMLKILSGKALFRQVPGIISKIVSFLRSKAIEIREAARATLCSVMELLGPRYLSFVMKELSAGLTRGYQLHILTFTTHSIMCKLADKDLFKPGDLDSALHQITDMALGEMFGIVAEEKEVRQITGKLMEARGTKSYDALQILAKFISNDKLLALAKPFADKAAQLSTFKNLQKIRECLRNIVLGLLENKELDPVACMVFVYGVTMDKLQMGATTVRQKNSMKVENNQSIFIVQRAPKRTGVVAKTSKSTSQHVVHEFGLSLLYFLLKRSSLLVTEEVHCQRLEPFIEILLSFCSSSHVTLTTTALRCLLWLVKFPLKVLDKQKILEITNKVFELLNKFGGGTDGKGENHDLVIIASKLLVVLIRDVELTQLDQTHLKTILDYVVTDVMDPFKSTTAFGLLSAILTRKLETSSTELHDVMLKMVELSIQSNSSQTRQAARSTVISYVSNYNLKKKLGKMIDLYCSQLNYEMESGRLSASESLRSVISVLHPTKTEPHASFLFVSLAPHLINDDSTTCRKAVSSTLSALIKIVSQGTTETLLKCCLTWYATADNPAHNQLACHLLTIFMDTVGAKVIKPSLDTILSLLPQHITGTDHLSVQALHLFTRLVRDTNETVLPPLSPLLSPSWKAVHNCLLHSHSWVRLLSAQLVGLYLANTTPDQMKENMTVGLEDCWLGSVNTFKSLVLDSMEQLSLNLDQESDLGTQVVKNLVALVKVTLLEGWEEFMEKREAKVTFAWIMKKSVKVANQELISSPKLSSKRTLVFNLIAASCLDTSQQNIEKVLKIILPPLHRNLSTNNPDAELKNHCQEVLDLIKSKIDDDTFSQVYMEIQMNLAKKKGERAITKKQNLVLNPKLAAKRKIQQNEAKKKAKKAKYKN